MANRQEGIRMQTDRREILHMLKYGRAEDVRAMVEKQKQQNYSNSFSHFMEQMLKDYRVSRKNVAVRAGLSQDYVYKLLRGDKRTDERDYILAMCFAIGMTLAQTQHALASYGMPLLSEGDLRGQVILLALQNRDGIDEVNAMLEKAGFPLLRTSPDMPRAPITDTAPTLPSVAPAPRVRREFEEIDSFTEGHHNGGNAPFDYDYQGWIKVRDPDGQVYQVEAVFAAAGASFIVFTEEQRRAAEGVMKARNRLREAFFQKHRALLDPDGQLSLADHPEVMEEYLALGTAIPEAEMLESYDSIEDAAASEFFPFFLEIDRRTDQKVQEVMRRLDDTREYGQRVGSGVRGGEEPRIYIEMFNGNQPELREYFQIVEYRDGTCRYTATHESVFMQIELGRDLYEAYFGTGKRAPEYFIDTERNDFSGKQVRYRFIFNLMRLLMHERILEVGGFVSPDPLAVKEEKIEVLVEQAVIAHHAGDEGRSAALLKEALGIMEALGAPEKSHRAMYLCTCFKLAGSLQALKDPEAETWLQRIWAMREAVTAACEQDPGEYAGALSALVDTGLHFFRRAVGRDGQAALEYVEKVLELLERCHACPDNWSAWFEALSNHAFLTEERDLQASAREYRRALNLARDHHLDRFPFSAIAVAMQNFNYGWVLWNRMDSPEAVLYFARAIDLLESYLSTGVADRETVLRDLKKVGEALDEVYADTGRDEESARLRERLAENGVRLE